MDFKEDIIQLSQRINGVLDYLKTEEATKTSLILPFIQILGYDTTDPREVVPEFTCDAGIKKGEKIDYAILQDGNPVMLIECKHWEENLDVHGNQLIRYFNVSKAKFGILTNGIIYRFYTDLVETNIMDGKPYFEINMTDLRDSQIEELKKYHKSKFNVDSILSAASELKYTTEFKSIIGKEFANPSPELVKLWAKQVYDGSLTAKKAEQFTALIRQSIASYISNIVSEKFKVALKTETQEQNQVDAQITENMEDATGDGIITTEEELEGFRIVKAILCAKIAPERITYQDRINYFTIRIDDKITKIVCKLHFNNPANKRLETVDGQKYYLNTVEDIYKYADQLLAVAEKYE